MKKLFLLFAIAVFALPLAAQEKKEKTEDREKRDHGEHYPATHPSQVDTTGTTHSVQLVWTAPVPPAPPGGTPPPPPYPSPMTYNVYKYGGQPGNPEPPNCAGTPVSSFFTISTGLLVLTFTDGPGIPNGVTRCYFVTAVSASGVESDPSTIVNVLVSLPIPTKPTPPTGVAATVI
jgi:hypothetical protein